MSENRKCVNCRHNIRKELADLTEYAEKLGVEL
jgi:hypothetical protein